MLESTAHTPARSQRPWFRALVVAATLVQMTACVNQQRNVHGSALDYLYADGAVEPTATLVAVESPARIGVAFAPTAAVADDTFSAEKKQRLLKRIADAMMEQPGIAAAEIIPPTYLKSRGGYDELDRLRAAFRISEIVLISFDQVQFSDTGAMGLTYWIYGVPAYVVKGEKNETRTLLDAMVLHIPSRVMLYHAVGGSSIKGSSTLVGVDKSLREHSTGGLDEAVDELILNLRSNRAEFQASLVDGLLEVGAAPAISTVDAPL